MKLALVQQSAGDDKAENIRRGLAALDEAARQGAALVVFPEVAFERFFPQRPATDRPWQHGETIPGPMTDAFCRRARELGIVVVLNLYERDGDRGFDCSPVIDADGTLVGRTRMIHITEYPCFHEQGYYTPGDTGAPVYRTAAGAIGVAICYDRHYPEYMRALALNGADLVVVPQAGALDEWPEGLYEGEMRVAAFQHGYFVALCNRVGKEDCLDVCRRVFRVRARRPRRGARAEARGCHPDRRRRSRGGCDVARPPSLHAASPAGALRSMGPPSRYALRRAGRRLRVTSTASMLGRSRYALTLVAVMAVAVMTMSCRDKDVVTESYATMAEARGAGAPGRGDLPQGLPDGVYEIRTASDRSSGRRWGLFNFLQTDGDTIRSVLVAEEIALDGVECDIPGRIEWWPTLLRGLVNAEHAKAAGLQAYRSGQGGLIVVVNWKQGRAYYWKG